MGMKTIGLWVGFICIFLCSCGVTQPQEQGGTEQWHQDTKKEKTASPKSSEEPKESYEYIEKKDIQIGGRSYKSIAYIKTESRKIYLYSLKTKEDVLYIPSEIEGCPVLGVGEPNMITAEYTLRLANWKEIKMSYRRWNMKKREKVKRLKKVVIPEGVVRIDDLQVSADEIIIPKSMKEIADWSFQSSQIRKVVVKSHKIALGFCAFAESDLEEIKFPDHYTAEIDSECFRETNLKSFCWPSDGNQINGGVFENCKRLEKVTFPENQSCIEIPKWTFLGCTKLTKLEFPASTKKVVYRETYYADNYKYGISTLVLKGKNTELEGGDENGLIDSEDSASVPDEYHFITVKKIVAPKGSKAIQFAKKALKISHLVEWSHERFSNCEEDLVVFVKDDFIPVEYEYLS